MIHQRLLKYKQIRLIFHSRPFASIGTLSPNPSQPLAHQHLSLQKTPSELASRLVSTHLLLTRWALELQEKEPKKEGEEAKVVGEKTYKTSDAQESLKKCIEHVGGRVAFTPIESQKILKTGLGEWGSEDLFSLEMRWESMGMLLWSLRILKDVPG